MAQPRRIVPIIVACALFMEHLDSTVLATALPAIARSLGEDPLRLNLAITSYLLSLAVFIPVSGWTADRFGARRVFRVAILIFVAGSVLCAFSASLLSLVGARVLQGMGGAMMSPVGRLVLLRTVPKTELVGAMAWVSMPALLGPVLGPPVGGFITTYFSWHWIFWINVPIGFIGVVLATKFIPETKETGARRLDLPGFLLAAVGLSGAMFGFETVGRGVLPGWLTATLLGAGGAALGLYVLYARRAADPVIALSLLRLPSFRAAVAGGFLFRIGVGATPFLLPLMLQVGFGLNPLHSGLLTFASAVGSMVMKPTAGPILRRLGYRPALVGNAVLSAVFMAAYGLFRPETPYALIVGLLLVGGFFRSLQFTAINTLAYADVPQGDMSRATSFASMAQQLSLTVGVALGAMTLHLTQLFAGTKLGPTDFAPAFLVVAAPAVVSALIFLRLPADAGAELTGRRTAAQPASGA
jgi:EmrB/QacA subfamily drug resistance transporter